jgi:hypothetical protein
LETGIVDRALYHALTAYLVPFYDPLLSWTVFNHRYDQKKKANKHLFRPAIPAWRDFVGSVKVAAKQKAFLLSTDLANYFEHIDINILHDSMLALLPEVKGAPAEKGNIRAHLSALFSCLREWCHNDGRGLPQNRDPSSFLANIYLLPIDRAMLSRGYHYFRYMDDIKVACDDEFKARRALKELSVELRKLGLSVNGGKTVICETTEEALANCLDTGGSELQQIDAIWQTRSIAPISRSFPILHEMAKRLLRSNEVNSREFRFCIKRLELLAQCPEFSVPDQYFAPITALVIAALPRHPAATDQFVKYLRAVPVSITDLDCIAQYVQDQQKNFYTWQNYGLWLLLVQKEYRSDSLLAFALEVVRTSDDNATRCGATLYVGALGNSENRIVVAQRFISLTSFLGQRAALIAVQELNFRPHIEDSVKPYIRNDLIGVFAGLHREGIYVASRETTSITNMIDLERDYA